MAITEKIRPVKDDEIERAQEWTPEVFRHRWTVEEFQRAGELGLFDSERRLELIDGEIYETMPPKPHHAVISEVVADALRRVIGLTDAHVRHQNPAPLDKNNQFEPDVAVIRGATRDYLKRHPAPADVILVVEVSDTTLAKDRGIKKKNYAAAGIPEYWIVNLKARKIEVFRDPQNGKWQTEFTKTAADVISPLCAPTAAIPVKDLLP